MLDRHLDDQLAQVDLLAAATSATDLRAGLYASREQTAAGGSFGPLTLEPWLYVARDAQPKAALTAAIDPPPHDGGSGHEDSYETS